MGGSFKSFRSESAPRIRSSIDKPAPATEREPDDVDAFESAMADGLREAVDTNFDAGLVGRIAEVDGAGRARVTYPGLVGPPIPARTVVCAPPSAAVNPTSLVDLPVLLSFEQADASRPIIVGFVRDSLLPGAEQADASSRGDSDGDVTVDGDRIVFEAQREIVLRCGKSTIELKRDGKVKVRGTDVLSRSSGPNRVRGASIKLN